MNKVRFLLKIAKTAALAFALAFIYSCSLFSPTKAELYAAERGCRNYYKMQHQSYLLGSPEGNSIIEAAKVEALSNNCAAVIREAERR